MKKFFAIALLLFSMIALPVSTTNAGIYDPLTSRCHDKQGKFIPGPNCDPERCGCLFHEIEEFIKSLF